MVRLAGLDFLLMEQMQSDIQKHVKNRTLPREKISEEQSDAYKRLQMEEFMALIEEANPYVRPPQMGKLIETPKGDDIIGKCMMMGPIHSEGKESMVKYIAQGSIAVMPIVAMDFSLANLTFSEDQCLHSTKPYKKCDYRDVLRSLFESY